MQDLEKLKQIANATHEIADNLKARLTRSPNEGLKPLTEQPRKPEAPSRFKPGEIVLHDNKEWVVKAIEGCFLCLIEPPRAPEQGSWRQEIYRSFDDVTKTEQSRNPEAPSRSGTDLLADAIEGIRSDLKKIGDRYAAE